VSAAGPFTIASSSSALAFQRSAQDRVAYLPDGSLLVGYWDSATPAGAYIYHVTNPSTSPVSTQVNFISGGDEVSIYTSGSDIWIQIGSELDGLPKLEQVLHGTYTSGSFSWPTLAQPIPGALTTGRQDPSLTWNGTDLIATWWDDTIGGNSDNIFYNWTTDKTGATGWAVSAKSGTVGSALSIRNGTTASALAIKSGTTAGPTIAGAVTITYNVTSGVAPAIGDVFEFGTGTLTSETRAVTGVTGTTSPFSLTVAALTNAHAMGEADTTATRISYAAGTGGAPVAGDVFEFGNGTLTSETRAVTAVSGTGPYTLSVAAFTNAHAMGENDTTATRVTYNLASGAAPAVNDWFQIGKGNSCACDAELRQVTGVSGTGPYILSVAPLTNGHPAAEEIRIQALEFSTTGTNSAQIAIRHSTHLGATIAVFGTRCQIYTRTLMDGANPTSGWSSESLVDSGNDDCEGNFGGPQIAIDETNGNIHVFKAVTNSNTPDWSGVTYWLGHLSGSTVTFASRVIIDATGISATDPPDIAGAVDSTGKVYIFWATSASGGAIKFVTLPSPYTTPSAITTVATSGANPQFPHIPAQAPLSGGYVPLVYQSGSGPYNIVLETRYPYMLTAPTGLAAVATRTPQVNLSWNASTGPFPITGYTIYRNGSMLTSVLGTPPVTTYSDLTVAQATHYTYTVDAVDSTGTHSPQSAAVPVDTPDISPPSVPTGLTATPTFTHTVNLSWTASTDNVGVTGYTIYRNGTMLATVLGTPPVTTYSDATVLDVTTYTYNVDAFDAGGNHSAQSAPAMATTPDTSGTYHPLAPQRVMDTRLTGATLHAGGSINLPLGGVSVPANATAVVLNVTATSTTTAGFFTVYPAGASSVPTASNLNWVAGETVPNLVMVRLGVGGMATIFNGLGSADAVVDLEGYYAPVGGSTDGGFVPLPPSRVTDTRPGSGQANAGMTLGPGGLLNVQISGVGGVPPTGAEAVVLNVTATDTTTPGFITAYPFGSTRPLASNLNWVAGNTVPNRVIVPLGSGKVSFFNGLGSADLVIDVNGYFTDATGSGAVFVGVPPARILDTRNGTGGISSPVGPAQTIQLTVAGVGGVPAMGASTPPKAVVINVTVTAPTAASDLVVWPSLLGMPVASDLNFVGGQTVPNLVVVKVGTDGKINIFNAFGSAHVVVDVVGWYG
jgi:hypothetical protein